MTRILLLALVLAVNNFFGAVSLSTAPLGGRQRAAIVGLFALSDGGLPLIGVLLGAGLARALGPGAAYAGAGMILLTALYLLWGTTRPEAAAAEPGGLSSGQVVLTSLALGLDNLGAAIGIGATGASVPLTLVTFAVVTAVVTFAGLWAGHHVHRRLPSRWAGRLAAALLFGTGLSVVVGRLRGA